MARPRTKPQPNRTADATILLRLPSDQRELIDAAIAKVQATLPAGAKLTITGFVLEAALERAYKALGLPRA